MSTKVTISVEEGASHAVRAALVATTTGQEYQAQDISSGKDHTFAVGDEQRIDITRGAATPEDAAESAEASTTKKK